MKLTTEIALRVHAQLVDTFGGAHGLRDMGSLASAMARPYQTFGNIELYTTPQEKAAALLESLAINHPFVDGNKRIAYTLYRLMLLGAGLDIRADLDTRYEMVIAVSKGELRWQGLVEWADEWVAARE